MRWKQIIFFLVAGVYGSIDCACGRAMPGQPVICNVKDYGATGVKSQDATAAFRRAVGRCAQRGGGSVYVGPGEYSSGPIQLKSNITFFVDAGATIFFNPNVPSSAGAPNALLYSDGGSNISIEGRGTLDGQAKYSWGVPDSADSEIASETAIARAAGEDMRRSIRIGKTSHVLWIRNSTNVHIEDISVVNSSDWSVRIDASERIYVHGVYVFTNQTMGVNGDGIDLVSSKDVMVSDSVIETGDDAIVLKTIPMHGVARPTENITVTNCVLSSSSTPLMIGTETFADIRHVVFSNIVIRNSNKGFGINVQDGATVSDVLVSNITMDLSRRHWNWWGSAETFKIVLKKRSPESRVGAIKNIVLDNIICHAQGTSRIQGLPEKPIENIRISRLQMFMDPESTKDKRTTDAIWVERVNGLKLQSVDVSWSQGAAEKSWRSALSLHNVNGFSIEDFSGRQAPLSDAPAIEMDRVSRAEQNQSSVAE